MEDPPFAAVLAFALFFSVASIYLLGGLFRLAIRQVQGEHKEDRHP